MIYFKSDYMCGGHPEVMDALMKTNSLHTSGYGEDEYSAEAEKLILSRCGIPGGRVFFFEGGTQTNAVAIDRLLDHNDGVVCVDTAHINVHEAGAIESNGHKVIALPGNDGKLCASQLAEYIRNYKIDDTRIHIVRPAMVYISYPTELGTLYSRPELEEIAGVCREEGIPLYIDGARLAYGLAAAPEVSLQDIAELADVFYIGGTKCGALFGEALVTRRPELLPRFNSLMKLHGAILAKGRLLGIQFLTLFANDLYSRIGAHATGLACKLKAGFAGKGYPLYINSVTNQQFFVMRNDVIARLREDVAFELWGPMREKETPVRFVTDWSTTEEDVERLLEMLPEYKK